MVLTPTLSYYRWGLTSPVVCILAPILPVVCLWEVFPLGAWPVIDRLIVRMHDVGEVDKYHSLQHDVRKGRRADVGDPGPSLGPTSDLLHPHTLQARHCVGGLWM